MKKSIILTFILATTFTFCQNQSASASKKITGSTGLENPFSRINLQLIQPKPVLQFAGGAYDPLDSTIIYDMYGSGGHFLSVIVFKNGDQQSGTGISITEIYSSAGGTLYTVSGFITRANSTTFSVDRTYDIS